MNRIRYASSNDGKHNLKSVDYDKNGNIIELKRLGHLDAAATSFGEMDLLSYVYNSGNKLLSVTDTSGIAEGFKDGNTTGDDYEYDGNGNMVQDKNKGNLRNTVITYNHLNLPTRVTVDYSNNITYIYDAIGQKLEKKVGQGAITHYAGNYVYETIGGVGTFLKFMNHAEGYTEPENDGTFSYIYQFKDHLGNIRLSYSDKDKDGKVDVLRNNADVDGDGDLAMEIREEKNYYPFGFQHKGYNNTISGVPHNYGFGGKEEQDELGLGWIDVTARNYDPALGRWMNIDPLADAMRRHSPYNYAFDNPIFFIDPDGMMPQASGDPIKKLTNAVVSAWNYFTSSDVSTADKTKTAYEAVAPDKLGLAFWDGASKAFPSSNIEVNVNYDGDFIKEAVGEAMSIVPLLRPESTVANVESKAASIEAKVTKKSSNSSNNGRGTVSSFAEKNNIYSGQKGLNSSIVDDYLGQMKDGSFDSSLGAGGFINKGKHVLTEGNHKMNAAIEYGLQTGDLKYAQQLINNGNFTVGNPSSYGVKTYNLPTR